MVIAKCVRCGKEYELQEDESPADFQCECGGNSCFLPVQKDHVPTNGADKKRKWNNIYKSRMEERQQERIKRNKKNGPLNHIKTTCRTSSRIDNCNFLIDDFWNFRPLIRFTYIIFNKRCWLMIIIHNSKVDWVKILARQTILV